MANKSKASRRRRPDCPVRTKVTEATAREVMHLGALKRILRTINVPVMHCHKCNLRWTDHRADKVREQTIKRTLIYVMS